MGKPEGAVEKYLGKLCQKNNILYYKFTSPGHIGVPDRILITCGKTIYVELKRPGGTPRLSQRSVIENMRKHGAKALVIDTKDEADKLVAKLPKKKLKRKRIKTKYKIYKIS